MGSAFEESLSRTEASKVLGTSKENIRYYESATDFVAPSREPNGYRRYSAADIEHIHYVMGMLESGFSIPLSWTK